MHNFKPKSGNLIEINELNTYLKNFNNIEFNYVNLVNFISNSEDGISGGNSTVIQMIGSRDNNELIILTFLPDNIVWVLSDMNYEDEYRFEDYPNYIINYSNDVVKNNIKWKDYGCEEMKSFFSAIQSIPEEGTESDNIIEFENENSQCNVIWDNRLTGLYMGEDEDYLTYVGFWNISLYDIDIKIENDVFLFNDNEIDFVSIYEELSTRIFDTAYNEEDNASVGVGLLQKI